MLDEHLAIPFTTEVLGNSVQVEGLDLDDAEAIVAITNINGQTAALSARRRYWTPATAALIATLLLLTGLTRNAGAQSKPTFYFRDRNGIVSAPVQHDALNPVDLDLVFETESVEERSRYPDLIIKDFRYGPTYFRQQTRNVPTVDFVVTAVDGGGHESATMFQVASQGGGADLGMLDCDVWFASDDSLSCTGSAITCGFPLTAAREVPITFVPRTIRVHNTRPPNTRRPPLSW
jgi:hypothetical protein